jgi:hypothetical protein
LKTKLFLDKHRIVRARFKVSHRDPDERTFDLGAPFLSLSYNFDLPLLIFVPLLIFILLLFNTLFWM